MLVLSRKASEQVVIGNDIVITVVRIAGGRVQLGIDAPSGISIRRAELADRSPTRSAAAAHVAPLSSQYSFADGVLAR